MFKPNDSEMVLVRKIAGTPDDGPVLMLNLNKYVAEAGYPDGALYQKYMSVLHPLLASVGGKVLWQKTVSGQVVGDQDLDEILAAWYPSHAAFLELTNRPLSEENFQLRNRCLERGWIHRCPE